MYFPKESFESGIATPEDAREAFQRIQGLPSVQEAIPGMTRTPYLDKVRLKGCEELSFNGRAWSGYLSHPKAGRIILSWSKQVPVEAVIMLCLHEVTHALLPPNAKHKSIFKDAYLALLQEMYGVGNPAWAKHRYHVVDALVANAIGCRISDELDVRPPKNSAIWWTWERRGRAKYPRYYTRDQVNKGGIFSDIDAWEEGCMG